INAFSVCYSILAFKLLKMGTVALYTLVLMCGGMIVPYIFGLVFLGEPFSALKTAGLAIILAGVVLANISKEKIGKKQIIICTAVFFLNGLVSVFSKLHQSAGDFERVNSTEFVLIGGIFKFIFAGILFLLAKKDKDNNDTNSSILPLILIISSAVAGGLSYMLQLHGAENLPATVLYPFITGGSIVATSVCSVIFFKEKLSKNLFISIILCFAGTLMFL
ncbi:MAG: EamA family transporter, partial [Clostridia bacterium]|nr:EamA family transporter [Clostridia bacterium]